jgi:hypothetical protein
MMQVSGSNKKKRAAPNDYGFSDIVFSWSLEDIFNENLFKDKVCFLGHYYDPHVSAF